MSSTKPNKSKALTLVLISYILAIGAALVTGYFLRGENIILQFLLADLVATVVIFLFSLSIDNSSFYDPYWSVAPFPIALYWTLGPGSPGAGAEASGLRQVAVLAVVALWGLRLTLNWLRGWRGFDHEDWREYAIQNATFDELGG